jgi:hypothetical protein
MGDDGEVEVWQRVVRVFCNGMSQIRLRWLDFPNCMRAAPIVSRPPVMVE